MKRVTSKYHKFSKLDAVYVKLGVSKVHTTLETGNGNLDLDKEGRLVGVEYLNAKQVTVQEHVR